MPSTFVWRACAARLVRYRNGIDENEMNIVVIRHGEQGRRGKDEVKGFANVAHESWASPSTKKHHELDTRLNINWSPSQRVVLTVEQIVKTRLGDPW